MKKRDLTELKKFHWEPQPRAQALLNAMVAEFMSRSPQSDALADQMLHESGTRFFDWIDHIQIPRSPEQKERLESVGFTFEARPGATDCYVHHGGIFPTVLMVDGSTMRIGIKCESAADFASAMRLPPLRPIEGDPMSRFRRVKAFISKGAELLGIERHGYQGYEPEAPSAHRTLLALRHLENFRRRQREFPDDAQGFEHLHRQVDGAVTDLGRDYACDLFFTAEREYWQRRNTAAQFQKRRQDELGLGWANHDHHTYRSSRACFTALIAVFEKLGFYCRERFYAGQEAGWGAQVLEQPVAGYTIFADVDMTPEEVLGDFSHEPILQAREQLGTVGLWCGLHGEAILEAGMHHLECQFDWHHLRDQMAGAGIKTMDPFTKFPHLRQAFTAGERWEVKPERLDRLLARKQILPEQAEMFRVGGAIGSHLENLERNDGYKGFNQTGVSQIIAKTDPRKAHLALAGA